MKQCSKCKRRRQQRSFNKKATSGDGLQSVCRDCQHKRHADWAKTSKAKKSRSLRRKKNRELLKQEIRQVKDRPCLDCGRSFHFCAMDFDHVRGEKKFEIGREVYSGGTLALSTLRREIEKCEVVCAVCHRIRTWKRNNDP
jgi:hypothetical protein